MAENTHTLRSAATRKFATIRECAIALLLVEHRIDLDGRKVGLDYRRIQKLVKKKFPVVTYNGPHKGQPTRTGYQELRNLASKLNREGYVLPVRPRIHKNKTKVK